MLGEEGVFAGVGGIEDLRCVRLGAYGNIFVGDGW